MKFCREQARPRLNLNPKAVSPYHSLKHSEVGLFIFSCERRECVETCSEGLDAFRFFLNTTAL